MQEAEQRPQRGHDPLGRSWFGGLSRTGRCYPLHGAVRRRHSCEPAVSHGLPLQLSTPESDRYRRASPRTGREGEGWCCPGVTARPCSQRPVPGQAPNRWRSGRAGLCRCYPGLGGTLSGAAGVPLPGQRRCPPLSAGQNPCAVPSPPGLAHLGRAQLHLDHGGPARRRLVPAGPLRGVSRVRRKTAGRLLGQFVSWLDDRGTAAIRAQSLASVLCPMLSRIDCQACEAPGGSTRTVISPRRQSMSSRPSPATSPARRPIRDSSSRARAAAATGCRSLAHPGCAGPGEGSGGMPGRTRS